MSPKVGMSLRREQDIREGQQQQSILRPDVFIPNIEHFTQPPSLDMYLLYSICIPRRDRERCFQLQLGFRIALKLPVADRLRVGINKQIDNKVAQDAVFQKLALEQANAYCQKILGAVRNPTVAEMVQACNNVGTQAHAFASLAEARVPCPARMLFLLWANRSHKKELSSETQSNQPPVCRRCRKGSHFARDCHSRFAKEGHLLQPRGNGSVGKLPVQHSREQRDDRKSSCSQPQHLVPISSLNPHTSDSTGVDLAAAMTVILLDSKVQIDLLKGDLDLTSPRQLTPEASAALRIMEQKLNSQQGHRRLQNEPVTLVIIKGPRQPYGLIGQLYQNNTAFCLWEWVFLSHQFSKTVTTLPEMISKLCYKGCVRCWELTGTDPETVYLPLTTEHLEQLQTLCFDFQIALIDYHGQLNIHLPTCAFLQRLNQIPLKMRTHWSAIPLQDAQTIFTDGKTGNAVIVWQKDGQWQQDIHKVQGSHKLSTCLQLFGHCLCLQEL
ncbi:uncharacterized protein LOC116780497 [Chiroxiphia lanceolata]|uniref:uncharacterized protein LOC116780497 n=1 Tax=Chiroxiphia lanceolata TaxID=296741 RepID=UPI0013CEF4CF|nr:uncharacterized protein LOC116780497 [Chiroxiphia lanceolata]